MAASGSRSSSMRTLRARATACTTSSGVASGARSTKITQHLYEWSYAQTEHFVGDSLVLRQFCRLGFEPVPHHTTLMRWSNLLQPETMHRLLDRVAELARNLMVTRGASCVSTPLR